MRVSLIFLPKVYFFSPLFFRGFFTVSFVKYLSVEHKHLPGRRGFKRGFKYQAKFIRKHLYWRIFFQWGCTIEICNFIKKRVRQRRFSVSFAKFLRIPILYKTCKWFLLVEVSYVKIFILCKFWELCTLRKSVYSGVY